jgi:hypothetical protein
MHWTERKRVRQKANAPFQLVYLLVVAGGFLLFFTPLAIVAIPLVVVLVGVLVLRAGGVPSQDDADSVAVEEFPDTVLDAMFVLCSWRRKWRQSTRGRRDEWFGVMDLSQEFSISHRRLQLYITTHPRRFESIVTDGWGKPATARTAPSKRQTSYRLSLSDEAWSSVESWVWDSDLQDDLYIHYRMLGYEDAGRKRLPTLVNSGWYDRDMSEGVARWRQLEYRVDAQAASPFAPTAT